MKVVAYVIKHNPRGRKALPIFERLERERERLARAEEILARAIALAESDQAQVLKQSARPPTRQGDEG
jgi:hypothetical protein